MQNLLRIKFVADTDGTGQLFAEVWADGFSGSSSACFDCQHLIQIGKRLADAYPLPANESFEIEGGFWDGERAAKIDQLHVGLKFYPIGLTGTVGCRVSLSTPIYQYDRRDSQAVLAVELRTTYEKLRSFARSLQLLPIGAIDEAVLETSG